MYRFLLVAAVIFLLASCGGEQPDNPAVPTLASLPTLENPPADNSAPTPVPVETQGTAAEATTDGAELLSVTIPAPGTMAVSATEDPGSDSDFSLITFVRIGGGSNQTLNIELRPDGTLIRNGATLMVSPQDLADIRQMLEQVHFFSLEGVFSAAGASSEIYQYTLTVQRPDGTERSIFAQDGLTPPELLGLFSRVAALGQPQ